MIMQKSRLEVNGTELYVEQFTGSKLANPTLLVMHGLLSSIALNDCLGFPDWRLVAEHYPVARFDVRGHGNSKVESEPQSFLWQNLAKDMRELSDKLSLDSPVICGSSMGAATTLHAVCQGMEVQAMILVIPPSYGEKRKQLAKIYEKFASIIESKGKKSMTEHWRSLPPTKFFEREYPESREISFKDFEDNADATSMATAFRGSIPCQFPSREALENIEVPSLILSRIDDPVHPIESAKYLKECLTNSSHLCAQTYDDVQAWPGEVVNFIREVTG